MAAHEFKLNKHCISSVEKISEVFCRVLMAQGKVRMALNNDKTCFRSVRGHGKAASVDMGMLGLQRITGGPRALVFVVHYTTMENWASIYRGEKLSVMGRQCIHAYGRSGRSTTESRMSRPIAIQMFVQDLINRGLNVYLTAGDVYQIDGDISLVDIHTVSIGCTHWGHRIIRLV